jgi:hypothetical protein
MAIKKGENSAIIQLTLQLLNYVAKHSGDEKQNRGFYIAKRWLMFDPDVRKELGEDLWKELLAHYSITNIEQQKLKQMEEEAKRIREEARFKIDQLKAEAYANQTDLTKEKQLDKRQAERLETPEYRELTKKKREAENFLAEIERGEHKIVTEEQKTKVKADIAELDQKMKAFLEA